MIIAKRPKAPKMGIRQAAHVRSPSHLQFVRSHVCCVMDRHACTGPVVAHHVKESMDGGMGVKPGDDFAIPLCDGAHKLLHDIGEPDFSARFGVDLLAVAAKFWRISSAGQRYRAERGQ